MEELNRIEVDEEKKRNGFFTVWLIISIVMTFISSIVNLIFFDWIARNNRGTPDWAPTAIMFMGLLGLLMTGTLIAIWYWKKWGVIANVILSVGVFILNVTLGLSFGTALLGFVGTGLILYLSVKQWKYFN